MNKSAKQWEAVDPRAVVSGSRAQAENVLAMALEDIKELAAKTERLTRWLHEAEKASAA